MKCALAFCEKPATHRSFKDVKWEFGGFKWVPHLPSDLCRSHALARRKNGDETIQTHAALVTADIHNEDRVGHWKNGRNLFRSTDQEWHSYRTWCDRAVWSERRLVGIDNLTDLYDKCYDKYYARSR